jgi:flagellar basal-body rod protein FlgB
MMNLYGTTFRALEQSLNATTIRQNFISSNIANVDTPNYKAKDVVFQQELKKALNQNGNSLRSYRTHPKHLPFSTQGSSTVQPRVVTKNDTFFNHNGNNVDLDYEMTELAKNQLLYHALTERVNGHFQSLRTVINEGR